MSENVDKDLSQGTGLDVTLTRALSAFALHLAGASDHQIAKQLGFTSAATARAAWESLLASTVTPAERERIRRSEAARLDRLRMAWWNKAIDTNGAEQATATRMVLSIGERYAKLLGLDAPTRMEVYTPTSQEIAAYLDGWRQRVGITDEVEPDIVEITATVVDVTPN